MHTARILGVLAALGFVFAVPASPVHAGSERDYSARSPGDHAGTYESAHERSRAQHARALKARKAAQARERRIRAAYRANNPWWPFSGPPGLF